MKAYIHTYIHTHIHTDTHTYCKANDATIDNDAIIDHQDTCKYNIKSENDEAISRANDHEANAQSAEEAQQEATDVSHLSSEHLFTICSFPRFVNQPQKAIVSKQLHQPEYQPCAHQCTHDSFDCFAYVGVAISGQVLEPCPQ